MIRPSSKPSPRKTGSSNTQTTTSQTASTNWTDQNMLFCSGRELDTTDLTPTCTSSRLASLRCVQATQTSLLQNTYSSIVDCMMLWGGTRGLNRCYWGTSSMATWRSWGGQPPSWGQQASPSSVRQRRRRRSDMIEWIFNEAVNGGLLLVVHKWPYWQVAGQDALGLFRSSCWQPCSFVCSGVSVGHTAVCWSWSMEHHWRTGSTVCWSWRMGHHWRTGSTVGWSWGMGYHWRTCSTVPWSWSMGHHCRTCSTVCWSWSMGHHWRTGSTVFWSWNMVNHWRIHSSVFWSWSMGHHWRTCSTVGWSWSMGHHCRTYSTKRLLVLKYVAPL